MRFLASTGYFVLIKAPGAHALDILMSSSKKQIDSHCFGSGGKVGYNAIESRSFVPCTLPCFKGEAQMIAMHGTASKYKFALTQASTCRLTRLGASAVGVFVNKAMIPEPCVR